MRLLFFTSLFSLKNIFVEYAKKNVCIKKKFILEK